MVQATRQRVKRLVADASKVPVILDEAQDGTLVGNRVIHEVLFGEWRDHQQGKTRAIATPVLVCPCLSSATGARGGQRGMRRVVGLAEDRPPYMIVPAVRVIIGNENSSTLPELRVLPAIDRIHQ